MVHKNVLPAGERSAFGGSTAVLQLLTRDIDDPSLLIYMYKQTKQHDDNATHKCFTDSCKYKRPHAPTQRKNTLQAPCLHSSNVLDRLVGERILNLLLPRLMTFLHSSIRILNQALVLDESLSILIHKLLHFARQLLHQRMALIIQILPAGGLLILLVELFEKLLILI